MTEKITPKGNLVHFPARLKAVRQVQNQPEIQDKTEFSTPAASVNIGPRRAQVTLAMELAKQANESLLEESKLIELDASIEQAIQNLQSSEGLGVETLGSLRKTVLALGAGSLFEEAQLLKSYLPESQIEGSTKIVPISSKASAELGIDWPNAETLEDLAESLDVISESVRSRLRAIRLEREALAKKVAQKGSSIDHQEALLLAQKVSSEITRSPDKADLHSLNQFTAAELLKDPA